MNIDERIQIERESLEIAIFPRERREHAERLARLEMEKSYRDNTKPKPFPLITEAPPLKEQL
jgi:hypothetical protein